MKTDSVVRVVAVMELPDGVDLGCQCVAEALYTADQLRDFAAQAIVRAMEPVGWLVEWDSEDGQACVPLLGSIKPSLSSWPINATLRPLYAPADAGDAKDSQ